MPRNLNRILRAELLVLASLLCMGAMGQTPVQDQEAWVATYVAHSQSTKNLQAQMVQTRITPLLLEPLVSTGSFHARNDGSIRWALDQPEPYTLLLSDNEVYVFEKGEWKQRKEKKYTFIAELMASIVNGEILSSASFESRIFKTQTGHLVQLQVLDPKLARYMQSVKLEFGEDLLLQSLTITDSGGSTEMALSQQRRNTTMEQDIFKPQ